MSNRYRVIKLSKEWCESLGIAKLSSDLSIYDDKEGKLICSFPSILIDSSKATIDSTAEYICTLLNNTANIPKQTVSEYLSSLAKLQQNAESFIEQQDY